MSLSRSVVLLAALALLASTGSRAKEGFERVTSVEGITEYRLPNGLRVLLFPDNTKQTVTVNVTYLVGSRHEAYGETGMAHLLEHLVFKGTDKHPNIPQELTAHGARPNGSTSFDRTNYFETFQASDENLKWALELESDRMLYSHIWKKDLDSEMTVVRNEFESGENNPSRILLQRVMAAMFDWHNYGKSTIGSRSDIENVPIERLQAFYHRFYQPDNAVLTIAGRIDEAKTLALVMSNFGKLPRPERVLIPTYTAEPTQDGERTVTLRRVGDGQRVMIGFHAPSGTHPDAAALEILEFVLGDAPAGRLHKALVEKQKAATVYSFFYTLREPGVFFAGAEVRDGQSLAVASGEVLATIEGLAKAPVTEEEVARAKTSYLKDISLLLNQSDRVGLTLSEYIAKGDWRTFFLRRDQLRKVTPADVQRVALAYLKPANRTIGEFIPTKAPDRAEIPASPDLEKELQGYKGDKEIAQGEAFDPAPANIESRTQRVGEGAVKLALLPKKTRGGTVILAMNLHYGDLESLNGKSAVADLAIDMLTRGSEKHTRQQLQDALDKVKARLSVGGGMGALTARIETVRENLGEAMKLLHEVLRQPTFPADQFAELVQENLSQMEKSRSEPQQLASTAYGRHAAPYPAGDPRRTQTPDEAIAEYKAATLDQAKAFYKEFLGAAKVEVSAVGDFDPKEVEQAATLMLADWKAPQKFERIPQPHQDVEPASLSIEAPDKANAVFIAGQRFAMKDSDPDYPALLLGNYLLGGGFLNSRLAVRIRQKEGLSYGVGSQFSAGALDANASLQIFAIHAPQNTQKLEVAVREELARAIKDGFAEAELKEAKSGFLQSRQVGRAQDGALAGTLARHLYLGRTLKWDAELEEKVAALTSDEIAAAMRRHLDPAKLTVVRAGDFKKAKLSSK